LGDTILISSSARGQFRVSDIPSSSRHNPAHPGCATAVLVCLSAESSHRDSLPHCTASGHRPNAGGFVPLRFVFYRQNAGFARRIWSPMTRGTNHVNE